MFCGDKSVIQADFTIDDSVQNLKAFTGQRIVFTVHTRAEASESWF